MALFNKRKTKDVLSYASIIARPTHPLAVGFQEEYLTNSLACPYNPMTLCKIKYGTYNTANQHISLFVVNSLLTLLQKSEKFIYFFSAGEDSAGAHYRVVE